MTGYAELQVTSNFSFLRGASHPWELVAEAQALGHAAIAIADRNSLAGVVRAFAAARELGLRLVVGCRLVLEDGTSALCFPTDRAAYGRLCRLLTRGKRRAEKGGCRLAYADLAEHGAGQLFVALPSDEVDKSFSIFLNRLSDDFKGSVYLAAQHLYRGDDRQRIHALGELAARAGVPLVATNDVLYHRPERRRLQDVVTCIREGCTIADAGFRLLANAERHLKPAAEMARLFRDRPDAVARTLEIVERCRFGLDELRYEYPDETGPDGLSPQARLERLAWAGAAARYPEGIPDRIRRLVARELALIAELGYAPYFLTVDDIVREARRRGILCQGRGSAANSAVCYCLGITAVDPAQLDLLFERFISTARNEPPDIDVDFEHERREEIIQYIYAKYGRDRAALAATVICYRSRGAIREVGKVLGLSEDVTAALAGTVWGWGTGGIAERHVRELGLDPADPTLRLALDLAHELLGFPRHLSQHVGGFVITRGLLEEAVPIENAAMADRTVIEWDKDDLDALGMLKIDVLALGMLTCIRRAFDLIARHKGTDLTLATVPREDPAVYEMLCHADSVGVFQVESRAQMSMLPRLKPRRFYDLVIEVAIVRPGPIQGDMVHPYLRRRSGVEPVAYPSEALKAVLEKTLGVPLFQEQAMRIAMVGAGFSAAEADRLRRAMATFRHSGEIHRFRDLFISGMVRNGYDRGFAERCFQQIEGFGEYGFPESHAASFALLVYVSAWIKRFHPEMFAAALLNSQPMGFYAPAQIVRDAREHGVAVRPVDVNRSDWDCTLEPAAEPSPHPERSTEGARSKDAAFALRLGLRQVRGLAEADAGKLVAARDRPYRQPAELLRRAGLTRGALERLAAADAFGSLGLDRRQALWAVRALGGAPLPLFAGLAEESAPEPALPTMALGEQVAVDYVTLGLSLKRHPMALLRARLDRAVVPAARLAALPPDGRVRVAGLVLVRQRPGSAAGVIFMTLEDESGVANLVVWPPVFERFRRTVMTARLVECRGRLQREGEVIHVIAERLDDRSALLRDLAHGAALPVASRDFH
ncbi:MAG TPA: error-prone DNA polymerase [Stellaceae bacterium]|nr:error-prone DNA polymerase [Stellaceae bacterium]